ncbi:Hypothetical predicted protein [Olea europaea subsp. europaea]|uniref:Uncharacterized protein n=1 Tax=Olea europaea subsp. europaea TaxID=158383 RepID=A0A8S0RFD9_OLEEU|nr:Hypothetical predicted protein [Olea europaea subsp. europaea]
MEAEEILQLLDSYWFQHGFFTHKHEDQESMVCAVPKPSLLEVSVQHRPTLQVRSYSDRGTVHDGSFGQETATSPNLVMLKPKLQKIFSGKEITQSINDEADEEKPKHPKGKMRPRLKGMSKSLSELEVKELKGFMDLGFVFTEEDKRSSSLVSIIPGLQRWGEIDVNENNWEKVSRPYLSESWGVLYQRRAYNPSMKWKTAASVCDEINMKDQLRVWAQYVASTVRWS